MPEQFKQHWMQYRKDCTESNVTPTVADFLGVEFTDEEYNSGTAPVMSWKACLARREVKAMVA